MALKARLLKEETKKRVKKYKEDAIEKEKYIEELNKENEIKNEILLKQNEELRRINKQKTYNRIKNNSINKYNNKVREMNESEN